MTLRAIYKDFWGTLRVISVKFFNFLSYQLFLENKCTSRASYLYFCVYNIVNGNFQGQSKTFNPSTYSILSQSVRLPCLYRECPALQLVYRDFLDLELVSLQTLNSSTLQLIYRDTLGINRDSLILNFVYIETPWTSVCNH